MAYGGAQTELYSEVLAQVCLAFAIENNRVMAGSDLTEDTIRSLKSLVITHSRANLNRKKFVEELITFGNHPISKGFSWVDGSGKAMLKVKDRFKITKRYKIYKNQNYINNLSDASKLTLQFQGGKMSEQEAIEFEKDPLFNWSIKVREYDDKAKVPDLEINTLDYYERMYNNYIENF